MVLLSLVCLLVTKLCPALSRTLKCIQCSVGVWKCLRSLPPDPNPNTHGCKIFIQCWAGVWHPYREIHNSSQHPHWIKTDFPLSVYPMRRRRPQQMIRRPESLSYNFVSETPSTRLLDALPPLPPLSLFLPFSYSLSISPMKCYEAGDDYTSKALEGHHPRGHSPPRARQNKHSSINRTHASSRDAIFLGQKLTNNRQKLSGDGKFTMHTVFSMSGVPWVWRLQTSSTFSFGRKNPSRDVIFSGQNLAKNPQSISLHDFLGPLKEALSASLDVRISGQIYGSKLQRVFTLGDGCWLPISPLLLLSFHFSNIQAKAFHNKTLHKTISGGSGQKVRLLQNRKSGKNCQCPTENRAPEWNFVLCMTSLKTLISLNEEVRPFVPCFSQRF